MQPSESKRPRVFFGWYIVAAGIMLVAYQGGVMGYGFTAFIAPIAATFGWGYAQISLGVSFRGLEVGILDPVVGMLVDRFQPKRLVLAGVIIYGISLIIISQAPNLVVFYLGFLVLGLGNSLGMHIVPQTLMARWFKKNLGKASAIMALGGPAGGVAVPLIVRMIDTFTWQRTLIILAVGIWTIGIPLSFIFKPAPREGETAHAGRHGIGKHESGQYAGIKARDALRMPVFWRIGLAYGLQMGALHALLVHIMPHLDSLGIERSVASVFVMSIPLVSIFFRLPFGWLADTIPTRHAMSLAAALAGLGVLLFALVGEGSTVAIWAAVLVFAMALAGPAPIRAPLVRDYFGIKNYGTLYGLIAMFNMAGQLVFPVMAGWTFDTFGSYKPIFIIYAVGSFAAALMMALLTKPAQEPAIEAAK